MENVSKALIIVGSTLIALMIISVFVFVFLKGASINKKYDLDQSQLSLEQYNSKIEVYDKEDNSILDIITLINMIYDINVDSDYDNFSAIDLSVVNSTNNQLLNVPSKKNSDYKLNLKRNQVYYKNKIISTFNLLDTNIKELNFNSLAKEEKLTESKLLMVDDQVSKQSYQKRLFKYTFASQGFTYYSVSNSLGGKIKSVKFQFNVNDVFDNIKSIKVVKKNPTDSNEYYYFLDSSNNQIGHEVLKK